MRLIDADRLIDDYNESDGTISDLMELILDAEEMKLDHVIRCKDCKFRTGDILGQPNILCANMKDDDFCSYAEKKETEV